MPFDVAEIRRQFPILSQSVNGHPIAYLDSAATAQKPAAVLEAMDAFYRCDNANAHRGMYPLAERATVAYEEARAAVGRFIGASRPEESVFTKSSTESINMAARCWGRARRWAPRVASSAPRMP